MKKATYPGPAGVILLAAALLSAGAFAQETPMPDSAALPEMQMMMMEAAQPGPEHELLASLAGEWTMEARMWPTPGADPVVAGGEATNEMIMGNRWLQSKFTSTMHGVSLEGMSMVGFDRRHKEFVTVGFDNMGTYFVTASGKRDEETGSIVMSGTDEDPIFNMTQEYDMVLDITDQDHFTSSIVFYNPEMTQGADSFKMVQIKYTRKQ